MKRLLTLFAFTLVAVISVMAQVTPVQPEGEGTESNPYKIGTAAELVWLRDYLNRDNVKKGVYAIQTDDIDLSAECYPDDKENNIEGRSWTPIKQIKDSSYDGDGHSIKNLYTKSGGFFGFISESTLKNIKLDNCIIINTCNSNDDYYIGAIACEGSESSIINCKVDVDISYSYETVNYIIQHADNCLYVGGIVGSFYNGEISQCEVSGSINMKAPGKLYLGGIVGSQDCHDCDYSVNRCVNNAHIISDIWIGREECYGGTGGICGKGSIVECCINNGNISSSSRGSIGGISRYSGRIADCINYGTIIGSGYVKYCAGICPSATIVTSCVNAGLISSTSSMGYHITYHSESSSMEEGKLSNLVITSTAICMNNGVASPNPTNDFYIYPSETDLTSGSLTYALQDCRETLYWKQVLGTDTKPILNMDWDSNVGRIITEEVRDCSGKNVSEDVSYKNGDKYKITYLPHQHTDGLCTVCGDLIAPEYVDGKYIIKSAGNLQWFKNKFNSQSTELKSNDAVLDVDIDMAVLNNYYKTGWISIGENNIMYSGTFDGQGHTIKNLVFDNKSDKNHNGGLFCLLVNSTIKDLTISGDSKCPAGGLLAYNATKCKITNCHVKGTLECNSANAGGMVGIATNTEFELCSSHVDVKGTTGVGALIGKTMTTGNSLTCCGSYGTLTGNSNVGGLIGEEYQDVIKNSLCYSPQSSDFGDCYYDAEGAKVVQTKEQMSSGVTAWTLDNDNWGQKLGVDPAPMLGSDKVYKIYYTDCKGQLIEREDFIVYSNANPTIYNGDGHYYVDHYCEFCGKLGVHEDGKYHIATVNDLISFRDIVNDGQCAANAVLDADIDLSSICNNQTATGVWVPIGNSSDTPYVGAFDGNNHTIKGYYYASISNEEAQKRGGLFGYVGTAKTDYQKKTSIKNLTVEGTLEVKADMNGMLAGYLNYYSTIENCKTRGTIVAQGSYTGGIVGYIINQSTVKNCESNVTINSTNNYVGGIAGYVQNNCEIERCENKGSVNSTYTNTSSNGMIGGIVGILRQSTVAYSINSGSVNGNDNKYVGGLCGYIYNSNVLSNYSIGSVSSSSANAHALIGGTNGTNEIDKLYYDKTVCSLTDTNGEGHTTKEFGYGAVAYLLGSPWGQEIDKDAYPVLDGPQVYKNTDVCTCYSNTEGDSAGHTYINGMCAICGDVQPLTQDADGYYLIKNHKHLEDFRNLVNAGNADINARVVNDIDLSSICGYNDELNASWTPIGDNFDNQFSGTFDGDGHSITGLYIHKSHFTDKNYKGLFGFVKGGHIANLTVQGRITSEGSTGMIVGQMTYNGSITNCHASGKISANGQYFGGIVGNDVFGDITDCTSSVTIGALGTVVGGIAGSVCGNVNRCETTKDAKIQYNGSGTAKEVYIGGIAGEFIGSSSVHVLENCRNLANVTVENGAYAGGLVGHIYKYYTSSVSPIVKNSYSTGTVTARAYAASIVAKNDWAPSTGVAENVQNVYYLNASESVSTESSDIYGEQLTADDFRFGYAAYKLQGDWGQTIGYEELLPVLDGAKVYEHTQDIPDWATKDEVEKNSKAEFKWSVTPSDGYAYVKLGFTWTLSCNESEDRLWLYAGDNFEKGYSYVLECGVNETVSELCGGKFRFAAVYSRGNDDQSYDNTVYLENFDLKWYSNNESDIFEGDGMLPGDINGDGSLSIVDISLLIDIVKTGKADTSGNADVDGDGTINKADITKLQELILNQ